MSETPELHSTISDRAESAFVNSIRCRWVRHFRKEPQTRGAAFSFAARRRESIGADPGVRFDRGRLGNRPSARHAPADGCNPRQTATCHVSFGNCGQRKTLPRFSEECALGVRTLSVHSGVRSVDAFDAETNPRKPRGEIGLRATSVRRMDRYTSSSTEIVGNWPRMRRRYELRRIANFAKWHRSA